MSQVKKVVIVVYRLDRLRRSLKHFIELINQLTELDIGLISLNDPVDTTSLQGRIVTNLFAAIAEFERELIKNFNYSHKCMRHSLKKQRNEVHFERAYDELVSCV
ncbi:recombinase family protein [Parashewanella spongiae]|uniref:recombinase family protein n=1 Tax=Parashewanella spongiae TaxID=342950 RepID=UPI001FB486D9|nr:recombinase family protein [Parashewanella spongiae]MCL1079098.1 recombinase family protein [Parashewanella spongiae]